MNSLESMSTDNDQCQLYYRMNIEPWVTIGAIRRHLTKEFQLASPCTKYRLVYNDQQLDNDHLTLSDYGWKIATSGTIIAGSCQS